jgi:undecaprenyl-diphosphatase
MLILGSIPCGVIGVTLKLTKLDKFIFSDPVSIALAFFVTGMLLRITGKEKMVAKSNGIDATNLEDITIKQALTVGFAQAFAILPGISRSGSTISVGLFSGIKREAAATFSFLLALPAVGGATFLELLSMLKNKTSGVDCSNLQLVFAVIISGLVSYFALTVLVNLVKKGKLAYFSWYLFAIGAIVLLYEAYKLTGK